jgi:O-antigen/teichoic acid export membrane protein
MQQDVSQAIAQPLNSLRYNAMWTVAGEAFYAVCQWGILIVIAKLGSAEMVGQFALGLAITGPVIVLTNLALRPIQATDARSEYEFGEYLALRLLTTGLALVLIVGVSLVAGLQLKTALIVLCVGLARSFEAISDVYYGLFQKHERMNVIATSVILKEPLSLMVLAIVIYLTGEVLWGVIGLAGAWALVFFAYDIPNSTKIVALSGRSVIAGPSWRLDRLASLGWLAWPLGLSTMLLALNANIPRYFVEHYFGERELGIFAAMTYVMVAGGSFMNAIGQPLSPRLAKYWATNSVQAFRTLFLKLVAFAVLIGAAGMMVALMAGPELLSLLYGSEYAARADVFLWLMIAAAIAYLASAFGYGMTAARLIRIQSVQFACAVAVGATCCMLLIPTYGLNGAAWAICASLLVQVAIAIVVLPHALYHRQKSSPADTTGKPVRETVRVDAAMKGRSEDGECTSSPRSQSAPVAIL